MSNLIKTDIAILGGGASGIAAAIAAKRTNANIEVVIAERLDKTGRKLLATGNGRCNLTNKSLSAANYRGSVANIMEIITETGDTTEFFRSLGVVCTADSEGRVYPYSRTAGTVLSALRLELERLGITEHCGFRASGVEKTDGGFRVRSENGDIIECRRLIAACGGYAAPIYGTDGSAARMFRDMGFSVSKICPSVAPLRVNPEQLKGLKGVRARGRVTAAADGKPLRTEEGEIQFTENSLSGICVFNLAYLFSKYEGRLTLRVDLMPELSRQETAELISDLCGQRRENNLEELLTGVFARNLAVYLVKRALNRPLTESAALKQGEIQALASLIKSLEFTVTGCSSWQNAQVTSGGISGSCVDKQLQSKQYKGLYFVGELLDVDGDCGGYNLEWAWSSGAWAGKHCAISLNK